MPFNNIIARADAAGNIPVEYSDEIAEGVVKKGSALLQLGRQLRDMTAYEKTLPVLSALATAFFPGGDTGVVPTSEVNWTDRVITAEDLAVLIPIPRNVLNDANIPLWDEVKADVFEAMGLAIDMAQLIGTNKPSTWPTAIVTAAVSASNNVVLGAGDDLYDDLLDEDGVFAKIEADGFGVTGSVAAMSMRGRLRGLRDSTGQPIFVRDMSSASKYALDGAPVFFPATGMTWGTNLLIAGEWRQLVYSIRKDMEFEVYTEGVIQDAAGNIVFNLMQQRMAAMMVVMRLGFQVPNPANREQSTEASRYPFGVLTSS